MVQKKRQLFHVHQIWDDSSKWISKPSYVAVSAVDYFQGLLAGGNSQFQQSDFDFIPHLVSAADNTSLCREPDLDEIRQVVFFIDPNSAPGPDRFYSRF